MSKKIEEQSKLEVTLELKDLLWLNDANPNSPKKWRTTFERTLNPQVEDKAWVVSKMLASIEPVIQPSGAYGWAFSWLFLSNLPLEQALDRLPFAEELVYPLIQIANLWSSPKYEGVLNYDSQPPIYRISTTVRTYLKKIVREMPFVFFLMWDYPSDSSKPTWFSEWLTELGARLSKEKIGIDSMILYLLTRGMPEMAIEWPESTLMSAPELQRELLRKVLLARKIKTNFSHGIWVHDVLYTLKRSPVWSSIPRVSAPYPAVSVKSSPEPQMIPQGGDNELGVIPMLLRGVCSSAPQPAPASTAPTDELAKAFPGYKILQEKDYPEHIKQVVQQLRSVGIPVAVSPCPGCDNCKAAEKKESATSAPVPAQPESPEQAPPSTETDRFSKMMRSANFAAESLRYQQAEEKQEPVEPTTKE